MQVGEAILLNIVMGAATDADRKVARATSLINALWADGLAVQQSCEGLLDAVEFANGGEEIIIEDASGGNMELIRAQWGGILNVRRYSTHDRRRGFQPFTPHSGLTLSPSVSLLPLSLLTRCRVFSLDRCARMIASSLARCATRSSSAETIRAGSHLRRWTRRE